MRLPCITTVMKLYHPSDKVASQECETFITKVIRLTHPNLPASW